MEYLFLFDKELNDDFKIKKVKKDDFKQGFVLMMRRRGNSLREFMVKRFSSSWLTEKPAIREDLKTLNDKPITVQQQQETISIEKFELPRYVVHKENNTGFDLLNHKDFIFITETGIIKYDSFYLDIYKEFLQAATPEEKHEILVKNFSAFMQANRFLSKINSKNLGPYREKFQMYQDMGATYEKEIMPYLNEIFHYFQFSTEEMKKNKLTYTNFIFETPLLPSLNLLKPNHTFIGLSSDNIAKEPDVIAISNDEPINQNMQLLYMQLKARTYGSQLASYFKHSESTHIRTDIIAGAISQYNLFKVHEYDNIIDYANRKIVGVKRYISSISEKPINKISYNPQYFSKKEENMIM